VDFYATNDLPFVLSAEEIAFEKVFAPLSAQPLKFLESETWGRAKFEFDTIPTRAKTQ
jgi:hypothetical protein